MTYDEVFRSALALKIGFDQLFENLTKMNQKFSKMISICGKNCPEWLISDFACIYGNFISVPLHNVITEDEVSKIFSQIDSPILVCDEQIYQKVVCPAF
jgi:long-subunit acyl-CoA synthetase (AMP-forming)